MESSSSDDGEPKICTVFADSSSSLFDTIAFSKNPQSPTVAAITANLNNVVLQDTNRSPDEISKEIADAMEGLSAEDQQEQDIAEVDEVIPTANSLFANAPDIPFPVGLANPPPPSPPSPTPTAASFQPVTKTQQSQVFQGQALSAPTIQMTSAVPVATSVSPMPIMSARKTPEVSMTEYCPAKDSAYDAWIPSEQTKLVLSQVAEGLKAGTYFPDKSHMTTPGIIYEDDLVDKVGINMARIFGEIEAAKRRILTADNVTQDDAGLRELIKLGCYRSAINLTKRLLTLYGQGPNKVGHFSKNNPHTLQLWFTRISLLVRIREFTIAESELEAFKDFESPDLYYEYYGDAFGVERKGSLVPFNFRLLAAEVVQYSRKHNETLVRLTQLLKAVEQILSNLSKGLVEDGSSEQTDSERQTFSQTIWTKREIRVLYSLANASLFSKDYQNAFKILNILCIKDEVNAPQLQSAVGRLFLQLGDLTSAGRYFANAASRRSPSDGSGEIDSDASSQNLVDAALLSLSHGAYPEAFSLFQQASQVQPDNFMITNNMAVCLLYMGRVKDSLALLETTVKNNIPELLQENVLLNVATIYELENSDGHKKNSLLKLISEYKGDGINLASLKMPNLI